MTIHLELISLLISIFTYSKCFLGVENINFGLKVRRSYNLFVLSAYNSILHKKK